MSLREEVEEMYWSENQISGDVEAIINKVLDAAVEALEGEKIPTGLHEFHDGILTKGIDAINKLRGEK